MSKIQYNNDLTKQIEWTTNETKMRGVVQELLRPTIERYRIIRQLRGEESVLNIEREIKNMSKSINLLEQLVLKERKKETFWESVENQIKSNVSNK